MTSISQYRICIEKPLPHEEHMIEHIRNNSHSPDHFRHQAAAFYTKKKWPKGAKILIQFVDLKKGTPTWTPIDVLKAQNPNIDPIEYEIRKLSPIDAVKKVVTERIMPIVDLDIQFTEDKGNVRVGFDPDNGSWSLVGTDCLSSTDKNTVNFGWLDAATMMHEFGHVLGMIHEHQSSFGNQIKWNIPEVYKWAEQTQGWDKQTTYNNIIYRYSSTQINGSQFDPNSIMLYFFPAKLTTDNKGTHENPRLSPTDVIYINKQYPNSSMTPENFYKKAYGVTLEQEESLDKKQFPKDEGGQNNGNENNDNGTSNNEGVIIGGVVGGVVLIILIFVIWRYLRKT